MLRTTIGALAIDEALPEEMRGQRRTLNKKGVQELLREVAERHPDEYREVSKKLADIGRTSATLAGGASFGLQHLTTAKSAQVHRQRAQADFERILNDDSLTDEKRNKLILHRTAATQGQMYDDILKESTEEGNPLALQVNSGARGNKMNLASLRGADLLYTNHRDEPLPLPVLRSYSEGLTPIQYWAATYGSPVRVCSTSRRPRKKPAFCA